MRICAFCREPLPKILMSSALYCGRICKARAWTRVSAIGTASDRRRLRLAARGFVLVPR